MAQLYHAESDTRRWDKIRTGVVCFVKDNVKKSYYVRLVDISVRNMCTAVLRLKMARCS